MIYFIQNLLLHKYSIQTHLFLQSYTMRVVKSTFFLRCAFGPVVPYFTYLYQLAI